MPLCTEVRGASAVAAAEVARALVPALARAAAEPAAAKRTRTTQRMKNKICIKKTIILPNFLSKKLGNGFIIL